MAENQNEAVAEAVVETKVVGKSKKATSTGNLIADIAAQVEKLEKDKALKLADELATEVEVNYFKLGGVLALIRENSWFEGYASFDEYVDQHFGFKERKGRYLITIYNELVGKMIPWEKVAPLGWTKLKDLAEAEILTLENVDEWVAKGIPLSVKELQAAIKAAKGISTDGGEGKESGKTSDEVVTLKFKLLNDQAETVKSALSKAKGETGTEFDTVALENICAGYLGGVNALANVAPQKSFKEELAAMPWKDAVAAVLGALNDAFNEKLAIAAEEQENGAFQITVDKGEVVA